MMRNLLAWGLIFLGVAAGYGLWGDIRDNSPTITQHSIGEEMVLTRARDGHFYATLTINGQKVDFMADTGATNMVLTRKDAARLGFKPEDLRFFGEANTANGTVRLARVRLEEVRLGAFRDHNFPAWVNEGDMEQSLLGMDYLKQFSIKIEGNKMYLSR